MPELDTAGDEHRSLGRLRVPFGMAARPRLTRRLSEWRDVTVVCGPTGSGKSTLIAMWAQSVSVPVLWCEPEGGELRIQEIQRFAAHEGVLVIDQCEYIGEGEFAQLGRVINGSPLLRVVLATRTQRTIRHISSATHAAVDVITAHDLAFSLEDLSDADDLGSQTTREELLLRSQGLASAVQEKIEDARLGFSGARERFRARLREDLRRHEGCYEAALRISLLPRVHQTSLDAWGLPLLVLHELEQAGIAGWNDHWIALHPYTRGVLLEDAEELLSAEAQHRLIAVAVRSSLIERDPLSALEAAFLIKDLDLATEVVFQNILELLETRDETYAVFTSFRASQLRGHPVLTLMLVLLSNMDPQTRRRALQLLATESLFQRLHPDRGTHRERVAYRVFEVVVLRLTPWAASALPRVRRAVEELVELSEKDMEKLGRLGPMLQVHLGISAFYLRDFPLAQRCFELADARHAEAARDDRVDPLSLRGGFAALSGDLVNARLLLDEADQATWPTGWRTSSPADFFNLGRAIVALEDGDLEKADLHLEAAGPIEEIVEHWTLFALVRARRDRLAGKAKLGLLRLKQLRKVRGHAPGTPLARSFLDAAEAELLLSVGDAEAARHVASRSAKHSVTSRMALAWIELALGRPASAARQAQRVIKDPHTVPRVLLEADLVLLCVALRGGFDREVHRLAEQVADRLSSTGLRAALSVIAPQDHDALGHALRNAGVDRVTVSLIGSQRIADDFETIPAAPLTAREQTVLEILEETPALDEIADRLFVSRNTIKTQLASIYRKLGVSSREAALTRAALLGILE